MKTGSESNGRICRYNMGDISNGFFEDMPTIGRPMKEVMDPLKIMAKIYAHTFINMSKMQIRSDSNSTSAYPGRKNET